MCNTKKGNLNYHTKPCFDISFFYTTLNSSYLLAVHAPASTPKGSEAELKVHFQQCRGNTETNYNNIKSNLTSPHIGDISANILYIHMTQFTTDCLQYCTSLSLISSMLIWTTSLCLVLHQWLQYAADGLVSVWDVTDLCVCLLSCGRSFQFKLY